MTHLLSDVFIAEYTPYMSKESRPNPDDSPNLFSGFSQLSAP